MNADMYDLLAEMFDKNNIAYNGTALQKLANYVDYLIDNGILANSDPEFADIVDIAIYILKYWKENQ